MPGPGRTRRPLEGIRERHARSCPYPTLKCHCKPSYQVRVWSPRDKRHIVRTFPTIAAAKAFRSDAGAAVNAGKMRAPTQDTVETAGRLLIAGMRDGTIRKRTGEAYKPSVVKGYESLLEMWIYPMLGRMKLSSVTVEDVQALADEIRATGKTPSTVTNALMPLRLIYRRARRLIPVNPMQGLELDTSIGRRERVADAAEAAELIAALPESEQPLWAAAFYTGMRLGELRGLRWESVDWAKNEIRVEWAWCHHTSQLVRPKSKAGIRTVPIPSILRPFLATQRLRTGGSMDTLVFGVGELPFHTTTTYRRAKQAWKLAGLAPITPHEARHSYASLMIAAGVNAKTISELMGHGSITVTLDRYGHLFPGSREQAASLLDALVEAVG